MTLTARSAASRVYPRVCGGTRHQRVVRAAAQGLSPRVRGNPSHAAAQIMLEGSIPACAGEPGPTATPRRGGTVYPRVCGGTDVTLHLAFVQCGLSPRVRGNLRRLLAFLCGLRSIPACAGEPHSGAGAQEQEEVYPRVCGGTAGGK